MKNLDYDILVIGAGHAGVESALAAARHGLKTAMFTIQLDNIAMMSCNPSIGGPGKSHLVAELDVLGGEIGRHTDSFNLQLKHLNTSKGPAARITRAQADKYFYRVKMKELVEETENLTAVQETIDELIIDNGHIIGCKSALGIEYYAKAVIIATGTFLGGRVVIGDVSYEAGRQGEPAATKLSKSLKDNGIELDRYQTATPPRVDKRTVDFSVMKEMHGEDNPNYFSLFTNKDKNKNSPTWLTHTTEETVKVAQGLLKYSPIVTGIISTHGPRHCPSLDRKVLNFPDKHDHQIFLELESSESNEIYLNGLTTAMPPFAQEKMMRTIRGLENANIMRYGYAVEYDYAPAKQLYPSLESKKISGLFFAGQINGTSGYEEAAAQGFVAGVNAARKVLKKDPIIFDRTEGYIGVLIDDIIHKETPEPYRVLPSRAEYRLTLRFDNAFLRLFDKSKEIGLIGDDKINQLKNSIDIVKKTIDELKEIKIPMADANEILSRVNANNRLAKGVNASELLKIKDVMIDDLSNFIDLSHLKDYEKNQIEVQTKYETFIDREKKQIEKFLKLENLKIPADLDFEKIPGISNIALDGLTSIKPVSVGEASRISGVSSGDIAKLISYINN